MDLSIVLLIVVVLIAIGFLFFLLRRAPAEPGKPATPEATKPTVKETLPEAFEPAPAASASVAEPKPARKPAAEQPTPAAKAPVKPKAAAKPKANAKAPAAAKPKAAPKPKSAASPSKPDNLLQMKGVGPKLVTLLNGLGVTRFEQIAAWTAADVERIDPQLGAFRGRIGRDQWIEQAGYLAKGDIKSFEAKFGKLDSEN